MFGRLGLTWWSDTIAFDRFLHVVKKSFKCKNKTQIIRIDKTASSLGTIS